MPQAFGATRGSEEDATEQELHKPDEPPAVSRQGWEGQTGRLENNAKTRKALQERQVQTHGW
jgi:hypothetical protein